MALAKAEERKNRQNYNDETDEIDKSVHELAPLYPPHSSPTIYWYRQSSQARGNTCNARVVPEHGLDHLVSRIFYSLLVWALGTNQGISLDVTTTAPFVTTTPPIAAEIHRIAICPTARPIEDCSSSSAKLRCESHVNV
jgi:hypothetical protein